MFIRCCAAVRRDLPRLSWTFALALGLACTVAHAQTLDVFGQPVGASSASSASPVAAVPAAPLMHVPAPVRAFVGAWLRVQAGWNARIEDFLGQWSHGASLAAWATLLLVSFGYGALHALGPGHGKLVVSTYLGSRRARVADALLLSGWTATVQALSAIVLVLGAAWLTRAGLMNVIPHAASLETASYLLLCVASTWAIWSNRARNGCCDTRWAVSLPRGDDTQNGDEGRLRAPASAAAAGAASGGRIWDAGHAPEREHPGAGEGAYLHTRLRALTLARDGTRSTSSPRRPDARPAAARARLGQIGTLGLAAGLRPCVGAIFALVTSLASHAPQAGVAATLAMAAGVATTVTLIGIGSVGANRTLARVALRRGLRTPRAARIVALAAIVAILLFSALQLALLLSGISAAALA